MLNLQLSCCCCCCCCSDTPPPSPIHTTPTRREMAGKYNIKYFYDIQDRSNFKANPDYKGVCHVALAQVHIRRGGPG